MNYSACRGCSQSNHSHHTWREEMSVDWPPTNPVHQFGKNPDHTTHMTYDPQSSFFRVHMRYMSLSLGWELCDVRCKAGIVHSSEIARHTCPPHMVHKGRPRRHYPCRYRKENTFQHPHLKFCQFHIADSLTPRPHTQGCDSGTDPRQCPCTP